MCKIFTVLEGSKIKALEKTVNTVSKHITASDRHGFGYAVLGKSGVFGERSCNPARFKYRLHSNSFAVKLPIIEPQYNTFGVKAPIVGPIVFHGRTSTNKKSLINTHPIQRNGWTLIHNGVVDNRGPTYDMITTNDTEHLVHYLSTTGMTGIEANLSGYYAFAAIDPDGKLHLARDSQATLYIAWSETIETYVIGTTEELIKKICKSLKWHIGPIDLIADNLYAVFKGNELLDQRPIKPLGYDHEQAKHMETSLHYKYDGKSKGKAKRVGDVEGWPADWTPQDQSKGWSVWGESDMYEARDINRLDYEPDISEYLGHLEEDMDNSYKVYLDDKQLEVYQFRKLSNNLKLTCVVYGPDGQLLDPYNFKKQA